MFLDEAKPHKRLKKTFRAIYFVVSLAKNVIINNTQIILPSLLHTPSYVAIDIHSTHDEDEDEDDDCHVSFFNISPNSLSELVRERDFHSLSQHGGVKEVAAILGTDRKVGITAEESDIKRRLDVFGSNTYTKPAGKRFLSFVFEAFKDTTIIILLACAVLSLGFGIKQHGPKEGWYDGGSIIVAVVLVVAVSAISNFKQSRQFEQLSSQSSDIKTTNVPIVQ